MATVSKGEHWLKGNSTVKTNRAQNNVHTFNKLFPKNLGPNHFSKREIVRQSSQIIQISTPCCSFPCKCKSGQRPECDVIVCFFIAGIKNTYRRAIQISKSRSHYKQNAALCCAIVHEWQSKNQRDGYKLSYYTPKACRNTQLLVKRCVDLHIVFIIQANMCINTQLFAKLHA